MKNKNINNILFYEEIRNVNMDKYLNYNIFENMNIMNNNNNKNYTNKCDSDFLLNSNNSKINLIKEKNDKIYLKKMDFEKCEK